ncbi:HD domain-containing protein [Carboxylicivirga linearis]|uniref:HDIG domain-containing protein n=1 Tax=Carboxylicivirga linearis TaxID=1628157 RepID=A0ABS5JQL7_9BACT|nr:HD domain-containing protein [Carboxylicivirga linearis]MBS2097165.1 HDIG domain-containing protein [Carboxylicivirga linearis]
MNPQEIIDKYYQPGSPLWTVLVEHSMAVTKMALSIAQNHPELKTDIQFIKEASMLHDIGIFYTNAPDLHCVGDKPYICHGYMGRELLKKEGYTLHALVCERHTGTGLSVEDIKSQNLPLPLRDMRPQSIEEQIICFADKFFSKSGNLMQPKSVEKIRKSMAKHGQKQVDQFDRWCEQFL